MTTDVPEVARELYAEPPDGFVASRNALVQRLKAEGDAETAATVVKLRRPTVAAATVNLAARRHGDLVQELLDAGSRLGSAQRQLLSGKGSAAEELRAAGEARRGAVRELTDAAVEAAAADGREADHLRDEIAGTFEAATLDDALGARLREGTIEKAVTPSAGLTGVEGFAVLPGGASDDAREAPSRSSRSAEQAANEAREARAAADEAARAADLAAEDSKRLAHAAEDAERAAREARAEERRLRDEATTARRRAERAERAARAAADRAER